MTPSATVHAPLLARAISMGSGILEEDDSATVTVSSFTESPKAKSKSTLRGFSSEATMSSFDLTSSAGTPRVSPSAVNVNVNVDNATDEELLGGEKHLLDPKVELDGVKNILKALSPEEKAQLSDATMPIRHFRAEKGNTEKAIGKLKNTLHWRNEFQVQRLVNCTTSQDDTEFKEMMKVEDATGKVYVRGYTKEGRAILYMDDSKSNTTNELHNMRHLTWNLERAVRSTQRKSVEMTGKLLDKYCLAIDFTNFKLSTAPSLRLSQWTLNILQTQYPERIYRIFLFHAPRSFRFFWNIVKPFVDPVTKEKVQFCTPGTESWENFEREFTPDQRKRLEACTGAAEPGKPFNSAEYVNLPLDLSFDDEY
jgi:hypothetical protein